MKGTRRKKLKGLENICTADVFFGFLSNHLVLFCITRAVSRGMYVSWYHSNPLVLICITVLHQSRCITCRVSQYHSNPLVLICITVSPTPGREKSTTKAGGREPEPPRVSRTFLFGRGRSLSHFSTLPLRQGSRGKDTPPPPPLCFVRYYFRAEKRVSQASTRLKALPGLYWCRAAVHKPKSQKKWKLGSEPRIPNPESRSPKSEARCCLSPTPTPATQC